MSHRKLFDPLAVALVGVLGINRERHTQFMIMTNF